MILIRVSAKRPIVSNVGVFGVANDGDGFGVNSIIRFALTTLPF